MSAEELVARAAAAPPAPNTVAALRRALDRFEGGYGCIFDPTDPSDVAGLAPLAAEEISTELYKALTASIERATARLRDLDGRP